MFPGRKKMWQLSHRLYIVLSHFKYIFVFCQFFATFLKNFDSFLSQFGVSKFNYLFIILLQSFVTFLSDFCAFLLHICHILEIAGPQMTTSTKMWKYLYNHRTSLLKFSMFLRTVLTYSFALFQGRPNFLILELQAWGIHVILSALSLGKGMEISRWSSCIKTCFVHLLPLRSHVRESPDSVNPTQSYSNYVGAKQLNKKEYFRLQLPVLHHQTKCWRLREED